MSILQKQKERDPNMGYARDFVGAMDSVMSAVAERGVRVVAADYQDPATLDAAFAGADKLLLVSSRARRMKPASMSALGRDIAFAFPACGERSRRLAYKSNRSCCWEL